MMRTALFNSFAVCFGLLVACSADIGTNASVDNTTANTPIVFNDKIVNYLNSPRSASSYAVVIEESTNEAFKEMKRLLSDKYKVRESRSYVDEIWFEKDSVQVDLSELESDRDKCAKGILAKVMPSQYADKYKLISIDEEWSFSIDEGSQITEYTFNYVRVFEGRVIRNNKNNLSIYVDPKGFFKKGDVALQDLKTTTEAVAIESNLEENKAALDSIYRKNSYSVTVCGMCGADDKVVQINEVQITGVADAYCGLEQGSDTKLLPCLSYSTKEALADGDTTARVIDAPYSRTSWDKYRK